MTTRAKPNPKRIVSGKIPSAAYWSLIERFPLRPLTTEWELDAATSLVDELIDRLKLDAWEQAYLDVLGDRLEAVEEELHPMEAATDGETFTVLREEKGVTQQQAALDTGLANSTISSVISGKRRFTREHLSRLADYFGVPVGTFAN